MRPALLSILFAFVLACTPQPPEQIDPEATYVGGDAACAEFATISSTLRQSSIFDNEIQTKAALIRELALNAEPAIRRESQEFQRSLSFEGQMSLPGAIQRLREACAEAGYME